MTSELCSQGCLPIMMNSNPAKHEPKRIILSISCLLLGFYHIKEKKTKQMNERLLAPYSIFSLMLHCISRYLHGYNLLASSHLWIHYVPCLCGNFSCTSVRTVLPLGVVHPCGSLQPPGSVHALPCFVLRTGSDLRVRRHGLEPKLCNRLTS